MFSMNGNLAAHSSSVASFNPVSDEDKPKRTKKQAVSITNGAQLVCDFIYLFDRQTKSGIATINSIC